MDYRSRHIKELEDLIDNKLLPIYHAYYILIKQKAPELDIPIKSPEDVAYLFKANKKLA